MKYGNVIDDFGHHKIVKTLPQSPSFAAAEIRHSTVRFFRLQGQISIPLS
jgi:hypothetical protein